MTTLHRKVTVARRRGWKGGPVKVGPPLAGLRHGAAAWLAEPKPVRGKAVRGKAVRGQPVRRAWSCRAQHAQQRTRSQQP